MNMYFDYEGTGFQLSDEEHDLGNVRMCTWTGKRIHEGFCISDGECYTDEEYLAAGFLRKHMGYDQENILLDKEVIEQAYEDENIYYSEWN